MPRFCSTSPFDSKYATEGSQPVWLGSLCQSDDTELVVAYLDDPHGFRESRQHSSYAGLAPRRYQSGEMNRHGRINKLGARLLRNDLVVPARLILRYNRWAKSVYDRHERAEDTEEESDRGGGR